MSKKGEQSYGGPNHPMQAVGIPDEKRDSNKNDKNPSFDRNKVCLTDRYERNMMNAGRVAKPKKTEYMPLQETAGTLSHSPQERIRVTAWQVF